MTVAIMARGAFAFGRIDGVAYSIAYTTRGKNLRLISFRRAHEKEVARYE